MSYLSEEIRQQVRQRAKNRCEYCLSLQDYIMGRLQIDHIYPLAKGGLDIEDNLCLACELCNSKKWTQTEQLDPKTKKIVPLYNPRKQNWNEHFSWSEEGTEIIGLTACGRATAIFLDLNDTLATTVRRNWVRAGWHPPKLES